MDLLFGVLGDEDRGSTRYRVYNMLPYLEESGIEADVLALVEPRKLPGPAPVRKVIFGILVTIFAIRLLLVAPRYDAVYLQKIPPYPTYSKLLSLVASDVIYDFDDALYTTKPWQEDDAETWEANLEATIQQASLIVVGSEPIKEYAERFADDVHVLPVSLPRWPYQQKRRGTHRNDDSVVIGWIGYPENLRYLKMINNAIAEILDAYEQARLHVVTAGERPVSPLSDRPDVEYLEWSLEAQLDYLAGTDIGIRPVTDDEWTRAKNFVSAWQFMALKRPVVVSPVGLLSEMVTDGESGFHAVTHDEWVEALSTLVEDENRRERMGRRALVEVQDHGFWTDQRSEELVEIVKTVDD